ncbi:MAG: 50S ribosomal protein L29 [Candidatus Pacebacteria bacterium]|nr:50S ribosomal protein L29 [Candidatus Paceibacterota bacterium]
MTDLKKKTEKELIKTLVEKRESLRSFRFDTTGTKIKNVKEGVNTRKDIARILTELRAREINE